MLLQFSIKNFRTFKDKAVLSLIASNYDKDTRVEENIFTLEKFGHRLLKTAVVFGANASGKSRLIEAISFMRELVLYSSIGTQKGERIKVEPFRLHEETENEPSEFEMIFMHKNTMYRYGFEADKKNIISEWLYYKPKTKEIELFYRNGNEFETHERNFSKGQTLVKQGFVRNNALFVSVAAQFNDSTCSSVIEWFQNLTIISGLDKNGFKNNTIEKIKNNKGKAKILEFLKAADLGIQDIQYEEFMFDDDAPTEQKEELLKLKKLRYMDPELFSDISIIHNVYNSDQKNTGKTKFSLNRDESNGTKQLLYLSGTIIDVLENGGILIGDEFDSQLHPNLVCKIISLFNSKEHNKKNAQLIFNTHDTNLLSSGLFRRDQIWFAEKNRYGAAKLYSLADFKSEEVKKNEYFEENYVRGKYGAIPFLGFFDNFNIASSPYENEK